MDAPWAEPVRGGGSRVLLYEDQHDARCDFSFTLPFAFLCLCLFLLHLSSFCLLVRLRVLDGSGWRTTVSLNCPALAQGPFFAARWFALWLVERHPIGDEAGMMGTKRGLCLFVHVAL